MKKKKVNSKATRLSSTSIIYPSNDPLLSVLGRSATRFRSFLSFFFLIPRLSLDLYYFSLVVGSWQGGLLSFSLFFPVSFFFVTSTRRREESGAVGSIEAIESGGEGSSG